MTVDLEPIKPPVIFLPEGAIAFDVLTSGSQLPRKRPRISFGREGEFEYNTPDDHRFRYTAFKALEGYHPAEALNAKDRQRYLNVPPPLKDDLAQLGKRWSGGAEKPAVIAQRVEQWLRTRYTYDLESPSGAAADPVRHFLFESQRGHCEFYSTSMALILRSLDIPSRNVTGFIGGTFNRFGRFYAVRQGDAHSWVEVHLPDTGWTRFDPTPAAEAAPRAKVDGLVAMMRDLMEAATERWDRHIVGYDLKQQMGLLQKVRQRISLSRSNSSWLSKVNKKVALGISGLLLAGAGYWYWRRRRTIIETAGPITKEAQLASQVVGLYQQLESVLRHHGVPRRPDTPPLAHARGLQALAHPIADDVLYLTEVYINVRFGNTTLTQETTDEFKTRLSHLKQQEIQTKDAA